MTHLAWVNSLPESWQAKPLRATTDYMVSNVDKLSADYELPVRLCNYTDVYNNDFILLSLDFMQATATEDEIRKFGLQVGDVVITKDSESWNDIGVPALVRETADDLVCGYHLALLRPRRHQLAGEFLFRCLQAKPIQVQLELAASGVTRFGLPKSEIGTVILPVPPLPKQRSIADYLDRETAQLDALLAEKERLLDLLAEKRRALIACAVTRGLDPDVPLRDSGIPWLGKIPAHWKVTRLKFVASVQTGITLGKRYENKPTREYPYLRVANVQDGYIDLSEIKSISVPDNEATLCHLRVGDVLMNEGGDADKLGRGAIWTGQIYPCLHQNHVFAVRPRRISSEWLNTYASSEFARTYFESRAKQSTNLASISASNLNEMPLVMPPEQERKRVLDHVDRHTAEIDNVRESTKRTISLLRERRSSLISAAVTGLVDLSSQSLRPNIINK